MPLRLRLFTPERSLLDEAADFVTLPTGDGEITVLPHHIPLATTLKTGIIRYKTEGQEKEIAVSSGFVEVSPEGEVRVLADTAERGEDLDLSVIEEAKKRAESVMKETAGKDAASFAAAAAALERELARYKVATKHRHARRDSQTSP